MNDSVQTPLNIDPDWWRQAVVYQIYPRSFSDQDGNGIGDLVGITLKVPYLKELGVDAAWLSPFYPSALADGGYDVDDYRDVDPKIGTLEDFDVMAKTLHDAGIKLIVDIVPNHSSDRHEWFIEALNSPKGSAARDRYIFRDGTGTNGENPPTDWVSVFGGRAWEPVGDGQWYLHIFAPEQPDLNWENSEVHEDFKKTLRFWSDRGVDGFRVDVAHGMAKDLTEPLPSEAQLQEIPKEGNHPIWDRDEVHNIFEEWREVLNEYAPPRTAVAEAWVETHRRPAYARSTGLGQAFNFDLLSSRFNAQEFRDIVALNLELAKKSGSSSTWVLSNHDVVRHATRYGLPIDAEKTNEQVGREWLLAGGPEDQLDRELGARRARAATLFELALPGSAYLYQGEELGLHEVADISDDQRQDPTFFRSPGINIGRDGCRVPLPWEALGDAFGFSDAKPHLPQPHWFAQYAADIQDADPTSTLNLYRAALRLRTELQTDEELEWLETGNDKVLAFRRPNGWVNITNFATFDVKIPEELTEGEFLLASVPFDGEKLPGSTSVWFKQD
ncbi:glycoside hydrolase family 13 protein [Rothia sp. ZJ932]|uniref:glycoside hydrolase family 13 protein n=1 Tax=Rothia sp. ZJ932 TaxID=2810516 RepID=UPI00196817EE|nr:glycoside hydrolase family 13 protein [Rothia sp. ZJ932]QRZ61328.1 glycoside hydrolase family 13 protein [Rothia sp. ZJ932]